MTARAVISDVSIHDAAIADSAEFEAFIEEKSPPGYVDFIRYIDGDYEFTKALMRIEMSAENGNTPQLQSTRHVVDVPDITDRGTAVIPAAETTVNFNKSFYQIQEVVATLVGGTGAAAVDIVSVGTTSFNVKLRDPGGSGNNLTSGTISWIARGY